MNTSHIGVFAKKIELDSFELSFIGDSFIGTEKYAAMAKADNGNFYCMKYRNSNFLKILEINLENNITTLVGNNIPHSSEYLGMINGGNGKLYAIPTRAYKVLEFDVQTLSWQLIGDSFTQIGNKWIGAVLANNGNIYCVPSTANKVLKINVENGTTSLIGDDYGNAILKWQQAVLADNGKIYCMSRRHGQILEINPSLDTTNLVGQTGIPIDGYVNFTKSNNGKIYAIPFNADRCLEFNPDTLLWQYVGSSYTSTQKWGQDAILYENGKIYARPSAGISTFFELTPSTTNSVPTTREISVDFEANTSFGGMEITDNKNIVLSPLNSNKVGIFKIKR